MSDNTTSWVAIGSMLIMVLLFAFGEFRESGKSSVQLNRLHEEMNEVRKSLNTVVSVSNGHTGRLDHLLERIQRIEQNLIENRRPRNTRER